VAPSGQFEIRRSSNSCRGGHGLSVDAKARDSVAGLYALGLVACGVLLDQFNLSPPWLLWLGNMVLAAYVVLTSYLWSRRQGLALVAARLHIPRGPEKEFAHLAGWCRAT